MSTARLEALTRHYRLAGNLLRAAEWAMKAAERAAALAEPQTALVRYRSAAQLLIRVGRDREAALALEKGGDACMSSPPVSISGDAFTEAVRIVDTLGDEKALKTRLHRKLSELTTRWGYCGAGRLERATGHLTLALALLDEWDDEEERSRVLASRAFLRSHEGDASGAEEDARRALSLAPPESLAWLQALDALECALLGAGRAKEALEVNILRIPVAIRLGEPFEMNDAYRMAAFSAMMAGQLDVAEHHARLSMEPAQRAGLGSMLRDSRTVLSDILLQRGNVQEAAEILEELVADPATEVDLALQPPLRRVLLAWACACLGDPARARCLLDEARTYPGFDLTHFFGVIGDAYPRAVAAIGEAESRAAVAREGSAHHPR